jgi:hypothetical protein
VAVDSAGRKSEESTRSYPLYVAQLRCEKWGQYICQPAQVFQRVYKLAPRKNFGNPPIICLVGVTKC